jgi:hypothetical protein
VTRDCSARNRSKKGAPPKLARNVAMAENREAVTMKSEFFDEHPTSFHLDCFTVLNEGFRQWEPLPHAALAKAFLVITAEDVSDGKFATRIIGISLNALKDMAKNGIRHAARPSEREREIVNACLENASRGMVERLAEKFNPFARVKGSVQ